jgi:hypothetical protein
MPSVIWTRRCLSMGPPVKKGSDAVGVTSRIIVDLRSHVPPHESPTRLHPTAGSLIAGALKLFVEIDAEGAGAGLFLATMAGQHRDRILRRGRQRILHTDLQT